VAQRSNVRAVNRGVGSLVAVCVTAVALVLTAPAGRGAAEQAGVNVVVYD
jgi:hypothetical protein